MILQFKASVLSLSIVSLSLWGAVDVSGYAGQARSQRQQMPVYRAGVDLVVLNVAVLDDDGEPVTGLTAEDFKISEDGVRQEIALFASSSNTPLDIALVLDMSGSVAASAPAIKRDAKAFLDALGPSDLLCSISGGGARWYLVGSRRCGPYLSSESNSSTGRYRFIRRVGTRLSKRESSALPELSGRPRVE